jgi:LCP family protein required for cell wall assembly
LSPICNYAIISVVARRMNRASIGRLDYHPWLGVFFGVFFAIFVLGGLLSGYLFYTSVREIVAYGGLSSLGGFPLFSQGGNPAGPDWSKGERVNVLLLGLDKRPQESCPCRTDTMIVVTLDPRTLTAGVLSIPRDLWVEIPGYGEERINVAHIYGDQYGYPGGGPGLAMRTVEYNLGIPIHYYVRINFDGFRKVVDALGGIDINVEKELVDERYPDENYGFITVRIPAGLQHMDGETALRYARIRHVGTDIGRTRRQQQVLLAIREKALSLNLLPKLPELLQAFGDTVDTNLQPQEILSLAQIAVKVSKDDISFSVIDETMTVPVIMPKTGAYVLFPDRERIRQLIDQIFPSSGSGD